MTSPLSVLPHDCWEIIVSSIDDYRHWEALSLVSSHFLHITNHLRRSLTVCSPHSISSILGRFPNLTRISIRNHQDILPLSLDNVLIQIADLCPNIETLDISSQGEFPLSGLLHIARKNRRLKKLDCSYLNCLTDLHLAAIGSSFPLLEELNISHPQELIPEPTDSGLIQLSSGLKNLRKLDISGSIFISDKSLVALSANCPLLSDVAIRSCDFVSQRGIASIIDSCKQLHTISTDLIRIDSLSFTRNLHSLNLYRCSISDQMLLTISDSHLPLKKLTLSRCKSFSFSGLFHLLSSNPHLEHLNLKATRFLTDHSIAELTQFFTKLVRINLSICPNLTPFSFLRIAKTSPFLQQIKAHHTSTSPGTLLSPINPISPNFSPNFLNLSACSSLNDISLTSVSLSLPNLLRLDVSACRDVSGEGIREVLRNCGRIRWLEMSHCEGVKSVPVEFDVRCLERLVARGSMIGDEGMNVISRRFRGLTALDLEGDLGVTAEGLTAVARGCKKLREVNLRHCENVSAEGVQAAILGSPSLRKVVPPPRFVPTPCLKMFLMDHGCLLCPSFSTNR